MNKTFKNTIVALTLSVFAFSAGSVLFPISALAATSNNYSCFNSGYGNVQHNNHHKIKISNTGAAALGCLIIGTVVVNAVKHHEDKKARQHENYE